MRSFWLIVLLVISCTESDTDPIPDLEMSHNTAGLNSLEEVTSEEWVCHHPDSAFHNQRCVEDEYPLGCYVRGNQSRFCWLLYREDCEGELSSHLLEVCKNLGFR
tara:strand:+ start:325 stop:639 length:315 start_codon:yes stop_codon:yes gene_type:complete